MAKVADLHIHTHFSDSTSSPQEVIEQAHEAHLSCIAIADHDTTQGIDPTIEAAKKYNIEIVPAVELSTEVNGKDVHILGYFFNHHDTEFNEKLNEMQNSRVGRMEQMIKKLNGAGINDITLKEVCDMAESKSVGRPHLAQKLVEKGHVKDIKQAFDNFLAEGQVAYVPKFKLSPQDGIALIKKAGGVSVLAHPMLTNVDEYIEGFVESGLQGIEVYYANTPEGVIKKYEKIAQKFNLLPTGGSDAHGEAKKHTWVGKKTIPYRLVEHLKQAAGISNAHS